VRVVEKVYGESNSSSRDITNKYSVDYSVGTLLCSITYISVEVRLFEIEKITCLRGILKVKAKRNRE
jgi:hypothetical protein